MTTLFRNLQQTTNYARFRPNYPAALYDFIVQRLACPPTLAIDVGCGTGQATFCLAQRFEQVIGMDPSEEQLSQIVIPPQADKTKTNNISFQVHDVESGLATLADESVACITAAQAAHWFDLPAFYSQVQRVLQPGGILAMWTYGLVRFERDDLNERVNQQLYEKILGPYWDDRRRLVENLYVNLPVLQSESFTAIHRVDKQFDMDMECSATELAGYLRSWSAYSAYCSAHNVQAHSNEDPIQHLVQDYLAQEDITVIRGKWPVALLWSQKAIDSSS